MPVIITKPGESFLSGKNKHASFKIKLRNVYNHLAIIYFARINGENYSRQTVEIDQAITAKVAKKTAIAIENKSTDYASVVMKATGNLNWEMSCSP